MTAVAVPLCLPWAVHISDGVLTWPWLTGGFVLAGLLAAVAAYRVRDEEIPRIALLAAAFFVASLIHVRLGPTSVHLLLNGLVGVVLGRRAALAIPLGLALQWALLGHGGFTTLGVNACVLTLPALMAGALFSLTHRLPWVRHPLGRSALVGLASLLWTLCLVFSVVLAFTNRWSPLPALDPAPALRLTFHPFTLTVAGLVALAVARIEVRLDHAPEFPLGLLIGLAAVLATLILNAVVLLWGGSEDWHAIVLLVFVAHLPVAAIEGLVLGFTVGFLARVKPEMLGTLDLAREHWRLPGPQSPPCPREAIAPARDSVSPPLPFRPPALFLAACTLLLAAAPAHAHRLEAEYRVRDDGRIQIDSWFDLTGDAPREAKVQVFGARDQLLVEGKTDNQGSFVFGCDPPQDLRVVVSAGAGHRKEVAIPRAAFHPTSPSDQNSRVASPDSSDSPLPPRHSTGVTLKDVLAGVGFLLALGAFLLSLRNARQLQELKRAAEEAPLDRPSPNPQQGIRR